MDGGKPNQKRLIGNSWFYNVSVIVWLLFMLFMIMVSWRRDEWILSSSQEYAIRCLPSPGFVLSVCHIVEWVINMLIGISK